MNHSKSSLFLMELIVGLLFFSLSSTICILLFVKSHTLSTYTQNMNYAVTQAQNMAEAFLGLDGDLCQLHSLFDQSILDESQDILTVYDNEYRSVLQITKDEQDTALSVGELISADIMIYYRNNESPIYTLHVDHYHAEREVMND